MKWLRPLLIFLLIATPSWAGFWSNFPGVGAGTVLQGIIVDNSTIDNSIINDSTINDSTLNNPLIYNPTIYGTSTYTPGTIVNYDPSTVINGPNGSIWSSLGITNLKNLTIAPGGQIIVPPTGTITGPDGATWTNTGINNLTGLTTTSTSLVQIGGNLTYATTSVITGPNGSTWNSNGITNLKNLTLAAGGVLTIPTGGIISGPDGGVWNSNGINNLKNLNFAAGGAISFGGIPAGGACPANQFYIALSSSLVPTCAPVTSIPGPVTINNATFTGNTTMPDGSVWSIAGIFNNSAQGLVVTSKLTVAGANNTLRVTGGIAEPTPAPGAGSFFYNTTGNYMEYWNGTSWITMAGLTGGACAAGDFVNSINSAGVITCGTPSGGGGTLPTPVSIGNGGLGQGVAPSAGQILVASGPLAYNPVTMSGAITISTTGVTSITAGAITDASLASAYSGVGACGTGLFVTALNRNAPPTCNPAGVIVSATAPATPVDSQLWFNSTDLQTYIRYNDGTSTQWVAVVNLAGLGGAPSSSPTFSGTVTMPDGSTWNSTQLTGKVASFTNLTVTGTVSLPNGSITDGMLAGAYSGVGACPAAQFVTVLNRNAAPTCAAAAAAGVTSFNGRTGAVTLTQADLNALGGPWLPVNNPTYTGLLTTSGTGYVLTIPQGIVQFSNQLLVNTVDVYGSGNPQITFPDTSDWWSGGLSFTTLTSSTNSMVFWTAVGNNNQAPPYIAAISANNGVFNIGQGARQSFSQWYADQTSATTIQQIGTNINFTSNSGLTVGNTFTPTLAAQVFNSVTAGTGIFLPNQIGTPDLMMAGTQAAPLSVMRAYNISNGGSDWTTGAFANTSNWIATLASSEQISEANGNVNIYLNTGLTFGTAFAQTQAAEFTPPANGVSGLYLYNSSGGNQGGVGVTASNGSNQAQMIMYGTGFTANPAFGPNTAVFSGSGGPLDIVSYSGNPIKFWVGNFVGQFGNSGDGFQGLDLGGFAGRINGNNGNSSLSVGNVYMTGTAFATGGISGAVFYNGSNWISDGGAGGGAAMIQVSATCVGMWNSGAVGGGAAVSWTNIYNNCGSGESVTHINNLQSARIPTITSGVLSAGSRDSFGWVTGVTGGQTTITFAEVFLGNSTCTLTPSSAPMIWFNANQSTTADTFVCYDPTTGQPCADGQTVEYHCFGLGDPKVEQAHP